MCCLQAGAERRSDEAAAWCNNAWAWVETMRMRYPAYWDLLQPVALAVLEVRSWHCNSCGTARGPDNEDRSWTGTAAKQASTSTSSAGETHVGLFGQKQFAVMQVRAGLGLLSAASDMADPLARLGLGQATRGPGPLLAAAACGLMAFPRPLGACVELGRPATADTVAIVAAAGTGDLFRIRLSDV